MIDNEAIREDADRDEPEVTNAALTIQDAADLFQAQAEKPGETKDAERPSKTPRTDRERGTAQTDGADDKSYDGSDQDDDEEDREDPDDDTEEVEDDDNETSNEKPRRNVADDDLEVEFSVDGETKRVSIKDLKRLAGQEAALTRKSQEVAETRKAVEDERTKYAAALDAQVQKARADFEPYTKIDFLVAQQRMDPESFAQLRQDAQAAHANLKFLESEVGSFVEQSRARQEAALKAQALECIKVLQDPEKGIPGWNNALYDEIRSYSIAQGIDADVVNSLVDPAAIRLLHKAMRFDRVQETAKSKVTRKVNAPKTLIKAQGRDQASNDTTSRREALAALRRNGGSTDAAADAFMAISRRADRD